MQDRVLLSNSLFKFLAETVGEAAEAVPEFNSQTYRMCFFSASDNEMGCIKTFFGEIFVHQICNNDWKNNITTKSDIVQKHERI